MSNLFDDAESAETQRLTAAGAVRMGCYYGVEMWELPEQTGHVSRAEALAWLERKEKQ